jgi:hypothetical protein
MMKNVYLIETLETCKVWKQYEVEAYTIDDAKRIVMGGEIFEQPVELDHYIDHDLGVDEIKVIKHCGTRGEL